MDRVIEVKAGGNYLSKDNKNAGVKGEGNVTILRITFDEGWDNYAKKVTFWDALGGNPVERTLTTNLLEDAAESTRVYLVPIPAEPMAEAGKLTFVIDGYSDGKRQRSLSDTLDVKDAPVADNAGEPTDPTPTQAEQLQEQIDLIIDTIGESVSASRTSVEASERAKEEADRAEQEADRAAREAQYSMEAADASQLALYEAQAAVGKTSYIGENGNWYAWNSSKLIFYDTGVKAQAGSTVYCGDNPPEEADVWIDPNGSTSSPTDILRVFVNIHGGIDNWTAENVLDSNNNVVGVRYGQVVNVNNAVITPNSKVDLQISSEQMVVFYEKDLAFVAENDDGVVTIYCIGNVPENDYTLQATVTEVVING